MTDLELELIALKISDIIKPLTPDERQQVFYNLSDIYCLGCWEDSLPCYCRRDD